MASLFKSMSPSTLTVDDALRLLSLPRTVGLDPATGDEIVALNGRYGPYLKKGAEGADTRSLASEDELFTVTLEEALRLFAEPKRRGRAAAAAPLRELGTDPATGSPLVIRSGRFGLYVTDGETNASLREREGDTVESLTIERAVELLQARRDAPPSTRGRKQPAARRNGAKKAAAKKGAAKKATAKKAAAKKTAGRNASAGKAPATKVAKKSAR
jgi:DNA topoisomerase-1